MKRQKLTHMIDDDTAELLRSMFAFDLNRDDYNDQTFIGYGLNLDLGTPPWWNPISTIWLCIDDDVPTYDGDPGTWKAQVEFVRDLHQRFAKKKRAKR